MTNISRRWNGFIETGSYVSLNSVICTWPWPWKQFRQSDSRHHIYLCQQWNFHGCNCNTLLIICDLNFVTVYGKLTLTHQILNKLSFGTISGTHIFVKWKVWPQYVQKYLACIKSKNEHCCKTSPFSLSLTLAKPNFWPYMMKEDAENYSDISSSEPVIHNICITESFFVVTILLNGVTFTLEMSFKWIWHERPHCVHFRL